MGQWKAAAVQRGRESVCARMGSKRVFGFPGLCQCAGRVNDHTRTMTNAHQIKSHTHAPARTYAWGRAPAFPHARARTIHPHTPTHLHTCIHINTLTDSLIHSLTSGLAQQPPDTSSAPDPAAPHAHWQLQSSAVHPPALQQARPPPQQIARSSCRPRRPRHPKSPPIDGQRPRLVRLDHESHHQLHHLASLRSCRSPRGWKHVLLATIGRYWHRGHAWRRQC